MPLVGQGGTFRWPAVTVDGAHVPTDPATLQLIIKDPLGDPILTVTLAADQVKRSGVGVYYYDWAVAVDADLGTYSGVWSGVLNGVAISNATNPDTVDVVVAGSINPELDHLLTIAQLRAYLTTTLGDDDLTRLRDAAELEILSQAGPLGERTDVRWPRGDSIILFGAPIGSIGSVVERDPWITPITLNTTDYVAGRRSLRRIPYGNHPPYSVTLPYAWSERVDITWTPVDNTAARVAALIQLVALSIRQPDAALIQSRTVGAHTVTYAHGGTGTGWLDDKLAILGQLSDNFEPPFA